MYAHNVISFHKNEQITPEQVLDIGKQFAEEFFQGHQCLITVHQDKEHLHGHIVTNSVSYIDGHKLHQTKTDLQKQKLFTNGLCTSLGLTIAQKGRHFDGTPIEDGQLISWSKNKFKLLADSSKPSYLFDCAIAVSKAIDCSISKEDFINNLRFQGWTTTWEDTRNHIVFQDKDGHKIRDSNLSKTFSFNICKASLEKGFREKSENMVASATYNKQKIHHRSR